jgi:ADP-ribose pyrophosphatase YjhB (NUDIX family)
MHYIQKHILDELRKKDSVRYAKLNNNEVESGHFRYHLGQLTKEGYVEQLERGLYGLTPSGLSYVDKLSEHKVTLTLMPKVITYTLLKDGKMLILQEKSKQPYMSLLNMVGGKLHEGELAEQAAVREIHEKTGVTIEAASLSGVFEVLITSSKSLLTHVIAYVFVANIDSKSFEHANVRLVNLDELAAITNLAPDFMPIFNSIIESPNIAVDRFEISL